MMTKMKFVDGELVPYDADDIRMNAQDVAERLNNLAVSMRAERNARLSATDWTQAADVPQATKDKWATYRQALRDVPQQAGFPDNIQWPSKPE